MQNILKITFIFCILLILCSFTPVDVNDSSTVETDSVQKPYDEKQFYQDAYNYRISNKMEVPDEYYDILGISNPNIPAFVKVPATESLKLRDQVPEWVRVGMLKTETHSNYNEDGTINYVNKKRGADCDIGPFQMRKIAFDAIKKHGESFWKLEKDTAYAEEMACRYLLYIYNSSGKKDWDRTVMMYNTGPTGLSEHYSKGMRYLRNVKKNSK